MESRSTEPAGQPLPGSVRERLENALDADLSAVRVHTGPGADRLARLVHADAFATGADIWFRAGAFRPGTRAGLRLLAHEAAHLAQQARGPVGEVRRGGWTLGRPGDRWEREADRYAEAVLAGSAGPRGDRIAVARRPTRAVQRHVSFEHRVLGDLATNDLVTVSASGSGRAGILTAQINLMNLWRTNPEKVDTQQVEALCPWIRTLRLGPGNLLVTYGELNALPDYLPDAESLDSVPADILLPILQVIRQEGYNELSRLLTGTSPNVTFRGAASAPWNISLVNDMLETMNLDEHTAGLGSQGQDHYQALLARNACHFAPYAWYRWQASHLIARDFAERSHTAGRDPELARRAWVFHGYADHFLEDSFAAGHLINKTLIMQWFIEWAAGQKLVPIADWDSIKNMTDVQQPGLAGRQLYAPAYPGPASDPQTAQEAATLVGRVLASGVAANGPTGQYRAYQNYLTFVTNAATQLSACNLHDYYNANSLWVASAAQPAPYQVWGDKTLLSGANGAAGVRATSAAAQMSQEALADILNTGTTSITVASIRAQFPTQAGASSTGLQDLQTWNDSQKPFCESTFVTFAPPLKALLLKLASPRLGVVSRDQEFANVWSANLPGSGYNATEMLSFRGQLFAGCNGMVYQLDPASGEVLHSLQVISAAGDGDFTTQLATDGTMLFVGVHGSVYAVPIDSDWTTNTWYAKIGGAGEYPEVSLRYAGGALYAGSAGSAYQLDPATGTVLSSVLAVSGLEPGAYDTRLDTDGTTLFVGTAGYACGILLADWSAPAWSVSLGGAFAGQPVSVLSAGGRLYAGCDGYAYQLAPASGAVLWNQRVTSPVGVGDYDTRVATDGTTLFVGVHGYLYGVSATTGAAKWNVGVGGVGYSLGYNPVQVIAYGDWVYAGSNGYLYQVDPATGTIQNGRLLTYAVGAGTYQTVLATDGTNLYAGVNGYAYRVQAQSRALDGGLYHDWQDQDGNWHGWTPGFGSAPPAVRYVTAAMCGSGDLEAFLLDSTNTLYRDWVDSAGTWHGWTEAGAPAAMQQVALATGPSGELELLGVGVDGTLYRTWETGGVWQPWTTGVDNAPAAMQSALPVLGPDGNLHVFCLGADGTLYHDWLDGGGAWHGWTPSLDGAPGPMQWVFACPAPSGKELAVFAVGVDGTLYFDQMNGLGVWQGWQPDADGAPEGVQSVHAALGPTGNLEVFAIGNDGTLLHDWIDPAGNWHGWTPSFDEAPVAMRSVYAATGGTGCLEVFAISTAGVLYHDWLDTDNEWHGWTPNYDNAPASVQAVSGTVGPTKSMEVFILSGAGQQS